MGDKLESDPKPSMNMTIHHTRSLNVNMNSTVTFNKVHSSPQSTPSLAVSSYLHPLLSLLMFNAVALGALTSAVPFVP